MQWNIITPTFISIFLQAPARVGVLTRIQSVFIAERAKNLSTLEQRYFFFIFLGVQDLVVCLHAGSLAYKVKVFFFYSFKQTPCVLNCGLLGSRKHFVLLKDKM